MNPKVKAKWLAALKRGKFVQGRDYMKWEGGEGQLRHCCLGVLQEVALREGVEFLPVWGSTNRLPHQVAEWAGLSWRTAAELAKINDDSSDYLPAIHYIKERL